MNCKISPSLPKIYFLTIHHCIHPKWNAFPLLLHSVLSLSLCWAGFLHETDFVQYSCTLHYCRALRTFENLLSLNCKISSSLSKFPFIISYILNEMPFSLHYARILHFLPIKYGNLLQIQIHFQHEKVTFCCTFALFPHKKLSFKREMEINPHKYFISCSVF